MKQTFANKHPNHNTNADQDHSLDEYSLPPRSTLFPSAKDRWTRWFYHFLSITFFLLVIGLISYGIFIRD